MRSKNFQLIQKIYEKGLSQADLVQKATLKSETRLSRIINQRIKPSKNEMKQICSILECTTTEVF